MSEADRTPLQSPTVFEARFIDTATSVTDDLRVVIPSYDDGEHAFGVVWQPRVDDDGEAVLPSDGSWCAVTETAEGSWIVLGWTPG